MTLPRPGRWLAAVALLVVPGGLHPRLAPTAAADDKAFDKQVVDSLRDVHNAGADLYNAAKDYPGAFHTYRGSLLAVRPLLAHRPAAQKLIADGLVAADAEADPARRAFVLHETIEKVRAYLKTAAAAEVKPEPKPAPEPPKVTPTPPPPVVEPKPKVVVPPPVEPKPEPKPVPPPPVEPKVVPAPKVEPKPEPKVTPPPKVEPKPEPKPKVVTPPAPKVEPKPEPPPPPPPADMTPRGAFGTVTVDGAPLTAFEVTVVSLDFPKPRVFTAVVNKDGTYSFADAPPPGRYVVIVTGKAVPAKYQTTTTSGIVIEVKAGQKAPDLKLMSK